MVQAKKFLFEDTSNGLGAKLQRYFVAAGEHYESFLPQWMRQTGGLEAL